MKKYIVLTTISHLGKIYEPGSIIELDSSTAEYHGKALKLENSEDEGEKLPEINENIKKLNTQIEALREQKLTLEIQLKELGSAENAAESALLQVQTAINMIQAISPDQITAFKDKITALFN
jgi:septal ring factor EnvC (AmiA/AmiB activator)